MKYLKHPNSYIYSSVLIALSSCLWANTTLAQPAIQIDNQAAGTYTDPQVKSEINVLSNTVAITVQEVAGITISPSTSPIERADGGSLSTATANDLLFYNFDIQNTGNDTTKFFVPNLAQVSSLGSFQKAQYFDGGTWQDIPNTGYTSGSIAPNGKLQIRIVVKVNSGTGILSVTLGKTANPNQPRSNEPEDVYTIDNDNSVSGEIDGVPSNGVREAQATQELNIGQSPEALTVAKLNVEQPLDTTDNTVGFGLALTVLDTPPANINNVTPTDLTGRKTSIDGQEQTGILLTDAVPLGTKLVSVTAPSSDWIKIYEYSSSPIGANDRPDNVAWSTTPPDSITTTNIRRVGFFRPNSRITKGTTITGFRIKVQIINPAFTTIIYNIAQVLGSNPANPNSSNDTTPSSKFVYEESGDNLPNNYNNDGTKGALDNNQQPFIYPGIIDPSVADNDLRSPILIGEDVGNNNAPNSPAGEYLMVRINTTTNSSIKNGPKSQPTAIGPNNDNDDFTNKSTSLTNTTAANFNPGELSFTNTVINTSNQTQIIKVLPRVALTTDLPNGTIITLRDPNNSSATAIFTYQDGIFTPNLGNPAALVLNSIAATSNKDYTVAVDLPVNTPLVKAFPLQLVAFIDTNNDNLPGNTESQNTTIDRTYTGIVQVLKESRVLNFDRQPVSTNDGQFSTIPKAVKTDQFIEYRLVYTNISTPAPTNGNGNKTVNATNFILTEDGRASPNNWADSTTHDPNSASNVGLTGTITYATATGTALVTDRAVTKYINKITNPISPGSTGTFTFRRQVR